MDTNFTNLQEKFTQFKGSSWSFLILLWKNRNLKFISGFLMILITIGVVHYVLLFDGSKAPKDITDKELSNLRTSFNNVTHISDPLLREYKIQQSAKQFNMTVDNYRRLFDIYRRNKEFLPDYPENRLSVPSWFQWLFVELTPNKRRELLKNWVFIALEKGVLVTAAIALVNYFRELPTRKKQANYQAYQAWHILHSEKGQVVSQGRIIILEDLNKDHFSLAGVNANGADLTRIHLNEADLNRANFQGANLRFAQLQQANLQQANLQQANLDNADLREADLQGGTLQKANLLGADLREAKLDNANLEGAAYNLKTKFPQGFNPAKQKMILIEPNHNLSNAKLENARLEKANLMGADLIEANLRGANLKEALLVKAFLVKANLIGTNLVHAKLMGANLTGANLVDANLMEASLKEVYLTEANLEGANLEQANLEKANLEEANLEQAKLKGANLNDANFKGAKNLTREQVKAAKNWEKAHYDSYFRQQLGLPSLNPISLKS